jgi:hypothetical protein
MASEGVVMGRELRMVPPNWKHPTYGDCERDKEGPYHSRIHSTRQYEKSDYISLYDDNYERAANEWVAAFIDWHVNGNAKSEWSKYYWEYDTPPDEAYYRLYKDEEATWYQIYETVSEGSPVTPPFATKEELIEYMTTKGDFWKQRAVVRYGDPFTPYSKQAAEYLINGGYAPSFVVENGVIKEGAEALAESA